MKVIKKNSILIIAAAMICSLAVARPHYPNKVIRYVPQTKKTVVMKVINANTENERLSMAVTYLRANKTLTVKEYAGMTGLSKKQAKAELDTFASRKGNPIKSVGYKKEKVYVLR